MTEQASILTPPPDSSTHATSIPDAAAQYRALNSCAILSQTDLRGRITHVNDRFIEVSGYSREELIGSTHRIVNSGRHPRSFFAEMWRTIKAGETWRGEICNRAKCGRLYWVDTVIEPVRGPAGEICGFLSVRLEITDRKNLEERLQSANATWKDAEEIANVGHWDWDVRTGEAHWSDQCFRVFGEAPGAFDVTYDRFMSFVHPDDRARIAGTIEGALERGEEYDEVHRIVRADGKVRIIRERASVTRDDAHAVRMLGVVQDITDERLATARIQESEERYRALVDHAPVCIHEIDRDGRILSMNRAGLRMIDAEESEVIGRDYLSFVASEDRERIGRALQLARAGEPSTFEFRAADDHQQTFVSTVALVKGEDDRFSRIVGVTEEHTAQKRAESALRKSEGFISAVLDHAATLVLVLDRKGRIRRFNRAAERLSGFSREEVLGKTPWETVLPPDVAERVRVEAFEFLAAKMAGESSTYTNEWATKSGKRRLIEWHNMLLHDADDELGFMVSVGLDVTDRTAAEVALRASEARLRGILDSMSVFVGLLSLDGRVLEVNRAPLEVAGLTREDVVGRDFAETYWWSHDPIAQKTFRDALHRATRGEAVRYDATVRAAESEPMVIDVTLAPLRRDDGEIYQIVGSSVDVTERRRMETELRDSESRLRAVLEQSRDAICVVDPMTHKPVYFNRATHEQLGYTAEEFRELRISDIDVFDDEKAVGERIRKLEAEGSIVFETKHRTKQGKIRNVECRVSTARLKDRPGVIGVWVDIDDRKREEELRRLHEDELAHVGRLLTLGEMAGMIVHQVHQPLTAVANYAETLKISPAVGASDRAKDTCDKIISGAMSAGTLVRRIRDFVQKRGLRRSTVDLSEVVQDALNLCAARIRNAGVEVSVHSEDPQPAACADRVQLEQVVINLVTNAVEALEAAGVEDPRIDLRISRPESMSLELTVSDNGPGIESSGGENIFESFFTTKEEGVGMGLSVARSIAERHGGTLRLRGAADSGATFVLTIPVEMSDDD